MMVMIKKNFIVKHNNDNDKNFNTNKKNHDINYNYHDGDENIFFIIVINNL